MSDTSRLLDAVAKGAPGAADQLFQHVYEQLAAMARGRLAKDALRADFNPSDVVNEVYLKLCANEKPAWENRRHFYGAAARAMHQVLIDHARAKNAAKRGGGALRAGDAEQLADNHQPHTDALDIAVALEALAAEDERAAKVVRLRIYAGMTLAETASELGISERTASNDWLFARAWLYERLKQSE